jgi:hypothetical protein
MSKGLFKRFSASQSRAIWNKHAPALAKKIAELNDPNYILSPLTTKKTETENMGLGNNAPKTYLNILEGKFVCKAAEDTKGATKRTNAEGRDVWELRYDNLSGYVSGLFTREGKFGKELVLVVQDGRDEYQIGMILSSGYAKGFLYTVPNVDFSKEVVFKPWYKVVVNDGVESKRSSMYLDQPFGTPVPRAYTKDEPNGLPEMTQVTFKGQQMWDDTAQIEFLMQMLVRENVELKIKNAVAQRNALHVPEVLGEDASAEPEATHHEMMSNVVRDASSLARTQPDPEPTDDLPF